MSSHLLPRIAFLSAVSASLAWPLGAGWSSLEPWLTRWAPDLLRHLPEGAQNLSPTLCAMLLLGLAMMESLSRR